MSSDERDRVHDAFQRLYGDRYQRPGLEDRIIAGAAARRAGDRSGRPRLAAAGAVAVAFAVVAVALLLSVGRAAPPSSPAGRPGAVPSPNSSPEPSAPPTATPEPSAASTAAPDAPLGGCTVSQLSLRVGPTNAATSHFGAIFTFHNRSTAPCTLYGFPGLQMLDERGQPLPTSVNWGSDYIVHPQQPAVVTLRPGDDASFTLGGTTPGVWGQTCPTSIRLLVTPPNETHSLVIDYRLSSMEAVDPDGQQPRCGRFTVSPVYPGSGEQP